MSSLRDKSQSHIGTDTAGGRFAPSPTGDLHFGSLLAAVASCCEARRQGIPWRLRIDDIDGPRSVPGSSQRIQEALRLYGMPWDDDIVWQGQHHERYTNALAELIRLGLVFSCGCSRRSLPAGKPYPGTCRTNRVRSDDEPVIDRALRLELPEQIEFDDAIQGKQVVALSEDVGDMIIWRRDKLVSYSLACALDDAMGCSEVVRGADLLPSTAAQIAIMGYLSFEPPRYAHIPVAVDVNNDKLSKHSKAAPIAQLDPLKTLSRAWQFLGQAPVDSKSVTSFWSDAVKQWDLSAVPVTLRLSENR